MIGHTDFASANAKRAKPCVCGCVKGKHLWRKGPDGRKTNSGPCRDTRCNCEGYEEAGQ